MSEVPVRPLLRGPKEDPGTSGTTPGTGSLGCEMVSPTRRRPLYRVPTPENGCNRFQSTSAGKWWLTCGYPNCAGLGSYRGEWWYNRTSISQRCWSSSTLRTCRPAGTASSTTSSLFAQVSDLGRDPTKVVGTSTSDEGSGRPFGDTRPPPHASYSGTWCDPPLPRRSVRGCRISS